MDEKAKALAVEKLLTEISKISSPDKLQIFLDTFFTSREKESLLRKVLIPIMLANGEKYRDIKEKLEISGNAISRIRRTGRPPLKRPGAPSRRERKFPRRKILPRYKGAPSLF